MHLEAGKTLDLTAIHLPDLLMAAVAAILVIGLVTALAPRVRVAGPLILVALGIAFSLMPFTPNLALDPEWILVGILPPLLYAAAVSLPAMEFRRDIGAIGGLSVLLVLLSSLVLGIFFSLAIPGLGLPLGIAIGAVLSPTDAVATSIVKRLGISPRVVTLLEGESLFNDATALVLLRTALVAVGGAFSIWSGIGAFSWAVASAIVIGVAVGYLNLRLRAWVSNTAAATAMSFVVPYAAFLPTEHFGGSGLVAAVVAGIVTGQGAAKHFTAEQRLSDRVNWHTIELILEGMVFLIMGLEVTSIINDAEEGFGSLGHAGLLALVAFLIIIAMRTLYVIPLVWRQSKRTRRASHVKPKLEKVHERFQSASPDEWTARTDGNPRLEKRLQRIGHRVRRSLSDMEYLESSTLGWREGMVIVWAGMRGAVTLAAAQQLPDGEGTHRNLLVLVAFLVAVGTLLVQGSTLGPLTKALGLAGTRQEDVDADQVAELHVLLREASSDKLADPDLHRRDGSPFNPKIVETARTRLTAPPDDSQDQLADELRELRLVMVRAQRQALTSARSNGRFSTDVLRRTLENLDAEELSILAHMGE